MYLLDLESVPSDPRIALTPNFRYGVTLFTLVIILGCDVIDAIDAIDAIVFNWSMLRAIDGTAVTPNPGSPITPVGIEVIGLDIRADCPSRNKFSTRKDADDDGTGCGTNGKVRNKL